MKKASIKDNLERLPGPEYIQFRLMGAGVEEPYIEGRSVIQLANRLFGHSGWSSSILSVEIVSVEELPEGRVTLTVMAKSRITLEDGTYREDVGFGIAERVKGLGKAKRQAYKSATTDAIKRALKQFGNALGLCCSDKNYIRQIKRMRKIEQPIDESLLIRPNTQLDVIDQNRSKKGAEYSLDNEPEGKRTESNAASHEGTPTRAYAPKRLSENSVSAVRKKTNINSPKRIEGKGAQQKINGNVPAPIELQPIDDLSSE